MLANVETKRAVTDSVSIRLDPYYANSKPAENVAGPVMADFAISSYGYFNLYPAGYPSVVPYPPRYEIQGLSAEVEPKAEEPETASQSTRLTPPYPFFDLCEFNVFHIAEMWLTR